MPIGLKVFVQRRPGQAVDGCSAPACKFAKGTIDGFRNDDIESWQRVLSSCMSRPDLKVTESFRHIQTDWRCIAYCETRRSDIGRSCVPPHLFPRKIKQSQCQSARLYTSR